MQWEKCYGGSQAEETFSIVQTRDSGFVFAAECSSSNDGNVTCSFPTDIYWTVKIDNIGSIMWEQCSGSLNGGQAPYSIIQCNDNGYAIAGNTSGSNGDVTGYHGALGTGDMWIVKLYPDTAMGINEIANKGNFVVYPNPVSETLTIRNYEYSPAQAGRNGEIRIYDVLGQEVYSQLITHNSTTISLPDISNGVYFYQLTNSKETYRGKFVKE